MPIVSQLVQEGVPISAINQILIDSVKAATVKNDIRKPLFDEIETLAEQFVTRWGSWIKTGQYYAKNLIAVRQIITNFEDSGKFIRNAKASVEFPNLI